MTKRTLPSTERAISLDVARQLYDFLRGGPPPDGICLRSRPRLSASAAFSVLYVLQEGYRMVPDTFEQCYRCHDLFDSDEGGYYCEKTGRHYCDEHIPAEVSTT